MNTKYKDLTVFSFFFPLLDVDECMWNDTCHENAVCSNTAGSFYCTCVTGVSGNGSYCEGLLLMKIF